MALDTQAGDGVQVTASGSGVGQRGVIVICDFVAGAHDPGGDPPRRRYRPGRGGRSGAVDGQPVPQDTQAAGVATGDSFSVQVGGVVDSVGEALPQKRVERRLRQIR